MGKIISWSVKSGKTVDFKETLRPSLCPGLVGITFRGGSKQSTAKSELLKELDVSDANVSNLTSRIDAYIPYVIRKIQFLHGKSDIFDELLMKLINCVPKDVNEVHFVVDSYFHNTIKSAERKN